MSDQQVPMDLARQAVRIAELSSEQHALAERVASDGQATRDALSAIQSDIKQVAAKFTDLLRLEHHHNANTTAIAAVQNELSSLSASVNRWMTDTEKNYERKWDEAIRDRDKWRKEHEKENTRDRETLIRWGGVALGISLLAGTVVGMFQWNLALRFGYIEDKQTRQETVGLQNRQLIENLQDGQSEIKLKLVRMEKNDGTAPQNP